MIKNLLNSLTLSVLPIQIDTGLTPTELFNLNFQSLEVVSRHRDTQLQVTENVRDL